MKKARFAFIGCGKIAYCHADAAKYLGHSIEVVVARPGSANIDGFAEKYTIGRKICGFDEFLNCWGELENVVDCVLVATPWDLTEHVLRQLLPLGVPVMSEKPAVLSSAGLAYLKEECETRNLFVAYNRRFYDFVPHLKELMDGDTCVCADVLSAEPCGMLMRHQGERIRGYMLYFYTSHIIDLLYYLFGDIEIRNVVGIAREGGDSWICELYSAKRKCPVQLKILMDCPQNSHFKIFFEKKVVEICPFEKMVIYNALERRESQSNAVYVPVVESEWYTDNKFKSGFLNQMKHFVENFVYRKNNSLEYIELLEKVTCFCDTIRKKRSQQ